MEAGLITPVLLFFVLGVFEYGRMFMAYNALSNTTLTGARQVGIQGSNLSADYLTLQAMKKPASVLTTAAIQRIVIWHAPAPTPSVPDPQIPSGCAGGAPTGNPGPDYTTTTLNTVGWCNVYTSASMALPVTSFGCDTAGDPDRFWCPSTRHTANTGPNAADYVGVYTVYRYTFATKLFGTTKDLVSDSVVRIEPQAVS